MAPARRRAKPKTWGQRFMALIEPRQAVTLLLAAGGIIGVRQENGQQQAHSRGRVAMASRMAQEALDRSDSLGDELEAVRAEVRRLRRQVASRTSTLHGQVNDSEPDGPIFAYDRPDGPPAPAHPLTRLFRGIFAPFRGR